MTSYLEKQIKIKREKRKKKSHQPFCRGAEIIYKSAGRKDSKMQCMQSVTGATQCLHSTQLYMKYQYQYIIHVTLKQKEKYIFVARQSSGYRILPTKIGPNLVMQRVQVFIKRLLLQFITTKLHMYFKIMCHIIHHRLITS